MTPELPDRGAPDASRSAPAVSPDGTRRTGQSNNVAGKSGLVTGLIGVGLSVLPLTGIDAWLVLILGIALSILGIVLAGIGLVRVRKGETDNKGSAIAGAVLGAVGLAGCLTWIIMSGTSIGSDNELHIPADSGDRHTVEFTVTSTGGASVHYGEIGDQHTETVLPSTDAWRQKGSYSSGARLLTLTADNTSASLDNTITCGLFLDGRKIAENTGSTIALCTANVR